MPVSAAAERRRSKYNLPFVISDEGAPKRVDGYIPPTEEVTNALGVYVIALLGDPKHPERIFLFPSHGENNGKLEATGNGVLQKISPRAREVITGGVNDNEETHNAVRRETREERGIYPAQEQFSNSLPPLAVTQRRDGKLYNFDVAGYTLQLTPEQAAILREQNGTLELSVDELAAHLVQNTLELRPAAWAALSNYLRWRQTA